jgi:2OG-Fe(II) oxygenase family oxidoreductase
VTHVLPQRHAIGKTVLQNRYDEAELGPETVIASVSFGATRKFAFRHRRTRRKFEMLLHHGQLIVMRGQTQAHWQHALMKSTRVTQPRVNLTFRTIRARG